MTTNVSDGGTPTGHRQVPPGPVTAYMTPGAPLRKRFGERIDRIVVVDEHLLSEREQQYLNSHLLCRLEPAGAIIRMSS